MLIAHHVKSARPAPGRGVPRGYHQPVGPPLIQRRPSPARYRPTLTRGPLSQTAGTTSRRTLPARLNADIPHPDGRDHLSIKQKGAQPEHGDHAYSCKLGRSSRIQPGDRRAREGRRRLALRMGSRRDAVSQIRSEQPRTGTPCATDRKVTGHLAGLPDGGWRARCGVRAGHGRCRPGTRIFGIPAASRLPARCSHRRPVRDKNLLETERGGVSRVQRGGQPSASKTAIGSR
jgi:hypothetical protein